MKNFYYGSYLFERHTDTKFDQIIILFTEITESEKDAYSSSLEQALKTYPMKNGWSLRHRQTYMKTKEDLERHIKNM